MMRQSLWVVCVGLAAVALCAPAAQGQKLLGSDATTGGLWDFTSAAGGPCPAPNIERDFCTLGTSCPGVLPPMPTLGTVLGDVATNRIKDTVWVTDGFTIHEYAGDVACTASGLSCTTLDSFDAPTFMGPITGMGMDSSGGTVSAPGTPVLWITDGLLVAGLVPTGSCSGYSVASGPFPHGITSGFGIMTDVTWDPVTGTLWLCDTIGRVHNIFIGGGIASASFTAIPGTCGLLTAPLVGIAYDTAWTASAPLPPGTPKLYVTDGFTVDYITNTGLPAAPTFYTPVSCTSTNGVLNGLAVAGYGVRYGKNRVNAHIGSFGQSSSPGPTWGLELLGAPAGHFVWLIYNYSFPGPGFFCPSVGGGGTQLWVDPGFPGGVQSFGLVSSPCMAYPLPLGSGLPDGLTIFVQFVTTATSGPRASDATEGLAFTIRRP